MEHSYGHHSRPRGSSASVCARLPSEGSPAGRLFWSIHGSPPSSPCYKLWLQIVQLTSTSVLSAQNVRVKDCLTALLDLNNHPSHYILTFWSMRTLGLYWQEFCSSRVFLLSQTSTLRKQESRGAWLPLVRRFRTQAKPKHNCTKNFNCLASPDDQRLAFLVSSLHAETCLISPGVHRRTITASGKCLKAATTEP